MIGAPKVVFIQNRLDDLGGVSNWIGALSRELSSRGYAVSCGGITLPGDDERGSHIDQDLPTWSLLREERPRRDLFTGPFAESRFRAADKRYLRAAQRSAVARAATFNADTILIFTQIWARECFTQALPVLRAGEGPRVIGQYHSSYDAALASGDRRRAFDAYRYDDLFTCLTLADAEKFTLYGFNNAAYVDNPVSVPPGAVQSTHQNKIAISLSRYDTTKQIDHMISAWGKIHASAPDWQLHLYGSGPEREFLQREIEDAGLEGTVFLKGPTADPVSALSEASISVNSSANEGFGLAIGEAALVGVPTVAYGSSPGISEVIQHGRTGIVAAPNDISALGNAILQLVEQPQLRVALGEEARAYVSERFNVSRVADTWERVFANVLR